MNSEDLYQRLDADFRLSECRDEWEDYGEARFVAPQFHERFLGVFLDNAREISRVYTAVFPSRAVLERLYAADATDALLLTHHAMTWDIRLAPTVFSAISSDDMEMLRGRRIAVYVLHIPLDRNGPYSTSVTLASALGLEVAEDLDFEYCGVKPGVICKTSVKTVDELSARFSEVLGHRTSVYRYGDAAIRDGLVAVGAGGGNIPEVTQCVSDRGLNTYLTGITVLNDVSRPAHDLAAELGLSLLGGTHYSTEKFACLAMCRYFQELGLQADFLDDSPVMEDL
jgi:putative NIF3 family GTP cyclohydrolase 1 type 2